MGLVQAENIQVVGEAYDIALDMSFPKGNIFKVYFCPVLFNNYYRLISVFPYLLPVLRLQAFQVRSLN